jgi:hypothetical protein
MNPAAMTPASRAARSTNGVDHARTGREGEDTDIAEKTEDMMALFSIEFARAGAGLLDRTMFAAPLNCSDEQRDHRNGYRNRDPPKQEARSGHLY